MPALPGTLALATGLADAGGLRTLASVLSLSVLVIVVVIIGHGAGAS